MIQKINVASTKAVDAESNSYLLSLYGNDDCHYCHRIRLALKMKNVTIDSYFIEGINELPQDVHELGGITKTDRLPIMLERDFVIPRSEIIILYVDERFPTPPLMPTIPSERVKMRGIIHALDTGIINLTDAIISAPKNKATLIRNLSDNLIDFSYEYFGDVNHRDHKFNLVDCMLAPVLWRLHQIGINIEKNKAAKYQPLISYMNYLFSEPSFISSCTEKELLLRS